MISDIFQDVKLVNSFVQKDVKDKSSTSKSRDESEKGLSVYK